MLQNIGYKGSLLFSQKKNIDELLCLTNVRNKNLSAGMCSYLNVLNGWDENVYYLFTYLFIYLFIYLLISWTSHTRGQVIVVVNNVENHTAYDKYKFWNQNTSNCTL